MFSKSADPTPTPPAAPAVAPEIPARTPGKNVAKSVLGSDLKITGEIVSSGEIEVLGEVDGNVAADNLLIGNEGRISGAVRATTIEVKGRLTGQVASNSFTMRASADVAADVGYHKLVIESGASIEGNFSKPKA